MHSLLSLSLTLLLIASSGPTLGQGMPPGDPHLVALPESHVAVAFVGVTLVPMDAERVVPDQTVIVRDGRIQASGPAADVEVPDDALVVDGAGRYLMPGLAEMHAHIPGPQQGEATLHRTLFLFLANGVTTLRGMLGHPDHLELRARSERDEILAPRIFTSSPSVNGNTAPDPESGRALVAEYAPAGYDFLKIHPGLSRETYDAVVEAAERLGIAWAGHIPADVGLYRALEVQQLTIDHLDRYVEALAGYGGGIDQQQAGFFGLGVIDQADVTRMQELAAATREAGVWNVPTQALMEHLLSPEAPEVLAKWPEMRYVPSAALEQWQQAKRNVYAAAETPERAARYLDVRRQIIRALHEAGAGLLLGADAPQIFNVPGFSTLRELQYMVDAGLSPYEALVTGTRAPAEFYGTDEWGTIREGAVADLVLVRGNPLEAVSHAGEIDGVMVGGHWLSGEEIARRLALIENALSDS